MQHDHAAHIEEFKKRFWICLILTIPVVLLSQMIQDWLDIAIEVPFQKGIIMVLSSIIYFYGGYPFLKGAVKEIKNHQPGMMILISMAISVAYFYSVATVIYYLGMDFFWELATLIDVMLLGHWIEAKSVLGASKAVEELVKFMPTSAHLVQNGNIKDVPVSELKVNDKVLVKPGEKIPSDGVVVSGESYVNEAMLTGESKPVHKAGGDKVIGGAINEEGTLTVEIQKTGKATYLAQVINLVKQAQQSRSKTQDLANRAAALLFYTAVTVGIITFIVWNFIGNLFFGVERAVTVLVIACPHALGLAVPLVVALSTTITARKGIFIRNRSAFELARNVNVIVFDKTGTLTEGKFGVSNVISYINEPELLKLTGAIEINSEHMIARAIVDYIKNKGIQIPAVSEFKAIPGKGAYAKFEGKEIYAGSPGLMQELNINIQDKQVEDLQKQGKTIIYVVIDGQLAGVFALSDIIRKESYEAVKKLKEMGIKTYMITGDANEVAESVAKELGIDQYYAQVLPHQKVDKIKEIKQKGYKVAMVGDGINDAPALVASDIGIAIGAGTDVAIESADIVLVKSNPLDVTSMISLSRVTYSKMVQNLWWAAGYNIIAIPLAAGILVNYGIVISPAIGALLMSLSTIIVAINSQTLRKYLHESSNY
ncbi:MAG: copper-translocating P-type ATPase [Candidatus Melainabacteria bacterium GWF2_37_15]|nr:MAG: copper-translocating P-type ATPase [Candidatus Melainabacteria bacterium GWF2_37_15]